MFRNGEKSRKRQKSVLSQNRKMGALLPQIQLKLLRAVDVEEGLSKALADVDVAMTEGEAQLVVDGVLLRSMDHDLQLSRNPLRRQGSWVTGTAMLQLLMAPQAREQKQTVQLWIRHGNTLPPPKQQRLQLRSPRSPVWSLTVLEAGLACSTDLHLHLHLFLRSRPERCQLKKLLLNSLQLPKKTTCLLYHRRSPLKRSIRTSPIPRHHQAWYHRSQRWN